MIGLQRLKTSEEGRRVSLSVLRASEKWLTRARRLPGFSVFSWQYSVRLQRENGPGPPRDIGGIGYGGSKITASLGVPRTGGIATTARCFVRLSGLRLDCIRRPWAVEGL